MSIQEKIEKLGINLPKAADPVGSYVASKISGKFLFISGQISIDDKGNLIKGKIGKDALEAWKKNQDDIPEGATSFKESQEIVQTNSEPFDFNLQEDHE